MDIKMNISIDSNMPEDEILVQIKSAHHSEELQKLIQLVQQLNNTQNSILGFINNQLYITSTDTILYFYAQEQKCYYKTKDNTYYVKKRLWELEEILDKEQFIRISNSCIANIKGIQCFDLNRTGNINVKFVNGDVEAVSQRKVSSIMKLLKERWG